MAQSSTRPRTKRKSAVYTGYRNGCIAFDIRQRHPWPVVLTTGNNIEDIKTDCALLGVLRHSANGHNYDAKVEKGRAFVRAPPNMFSGSGRQLRKLGREEVSGLASLCEDVLRPRASIWRTERMRDAVVEDPDKYEITGPEVPQAVGGDSSSKRAKFGVRMTIGTKRKDGQASQTKRTRHEKYIDKKYCGSYFGDNSTRWIPQRHLKPFTLERLAELKSWLTTEGQSKIQYEGAMRAQFLRAVTEALFLILRGWLPPSLRLLCGQFVLVRNGAEPPYLATVAHPRAELLWQEKTPTRPAEYVERVEVTYYTEDEPEPKEGASAGEDGDGSSTETDTPPDDSEDEPEEREVQPTLRRKVPRHFVSDFTAENLRKLRVHVDNPHYAALNEIVTTLVKRHSHLASTLGAEFDLALNTDGIFLEDGVCPAYLAVPVKKEKTFVLKVVTIVAGAVRRSGEDMQGGEGELVVK